MLYSSAVFSSDLYDFAVSIKWQKAQRHGIEGVLHLLATENQSLLLWWNTFLFLNSFLDSSDLVIGFNINFDLYNLYVLVFDEPRVFPLVNMINVPLYR
jgi:hypothetical protein